MSSIGKIISSLYPTTLKTFNLGVCGGRGGGGGGGGGVEGGGPVISIYFLRNVFVKLMSSIGKKKIVPYTLLL